MLRFEFSVFSGSSYDFVDYKNSIWLLVSWLFGIWVTTTLPQHQRSFSKSVSICSKADGALVSCGVFLPVPACNGRGQSWHTSLLIYTGYRVFPWKTFQGVGCNSLCFLFRLSQKRAGCTQASLCLDRDEKERCFKSSSSAQWAVRILNVSATKGTFHTIQNRFFSIRILNVVSYLRTESDGYFVSSVLPTGKRPNTSAVAVSLSLISHLTNSQSVQKDTIDQTRI